MPNRQQLAEPRTFEQRTGRLVPVVATLLLGASTVGACGDDDSSGSTMSTEGSTTVPTTVSAPPPPDSVVAVESDGTAEVTALFEDVVAAHEAEDLDRIVELSSGPARAFAERSRHFAAATGTEDLFPNLHSRAGTVSSTDDGTVTLDGIVAYGPNEANVRELTNFEFRLDGDRWLLHSYERTGVPIGQWVAPGSESPVESGPITVELISMFSDVTCALDAETDCPDELRNSIGLDLVVDNDSNGELEPGMLTLPDGTESPAWLETPAGGAHPIIAAEAMGFPPMASAPVIGLFAAADDLSDGGVLHIVLRDADGADHEFDLPVPAYPHDWSTAP